MWLLDSIIEKVILKAELEGFSIPEQTRAFGAQDSAGNSGIDILNIVGDTAEIAIQGILTDTPNMMALFFGGGNTTYPDIINAIAAAEQNDDVKDIILSVDSPGGTVAGLFNAVKAIERAEKPIKALVTNKATSAAYALIAQADTIEALNEASQVGSIGIAVTQHINENEVTITSSKAPKKLPNAATETGKAIIREQLDAFHDIFVGVIASGRGTTVAVVNADFGQGAVLLAAEAKKQGMVDSIANSIMSDRDKPLDLSNGVEAQTASDKGVIKAPTKEVKKNKNSTSTNKEEVTMDLKEFKAQHPGVFEEAVEIGKKDERDRVEAHLTMAGSFGGMDVAIKAITEGESLTQKHQALYMAAGNDKASIEARDLDDPGDLGDGTGDKKAETDAEDMAMTEDILKEAGIAVVKETDGGKA